MEAIIQAEVDRLLAEGIIEESTSPYSFPLLVVPKKNGKHRVVTDFRKLNDASIKNAYPLPHIHHLLDQLKDAHYVTSLDLLSGFLQIPLDEDSKKYCAFSLRANHYQYTRMCFGLHSAPASFQAIMNKILKNVLYKFAYVYLDDVLVASKTFEEHLDHLQEVFMLLSQAGFKINWEKSHFIQRETEYLGFVVGGSKISVSPSKTEALQAFPAPNSLKTLRSFLGLANWYRRFVPNMATLASPLTKLLQKNVPFTWGPEQERSFKEIKDHLCSVPKLYCPDFSKEFEIWTDASGVGIGGVILQRGEDGLEHPVAFTSKTLSRAERNYSVTERECYAVIYCLETFKQYVQGSHVTVYTDHSSLTWLLGIKQPQGRLARWVTRLACFNVTIKYKKGKYLTVPDTLSRAPYNLSVASITQQLPDFSVLKDDWYIRLRSLITKYPKAYRAFKVEGNYIFKRPKDHPSGDNQYRLYIPQEFRQALMNQNHATLPTGHLGIKKTLDRLDRLYYWPSMRADVVEYVNCCLECQTSKPENRLPIGQMSEQPVKLAPMQLLSLDFVGSLPRTSRQNQYIIVCEDVSTKFVIAQAVRNATAASAMKFLLENVFLEHGVPSIILVDHGSQFVGRAFREFCEKYHIKLHFSPKHSPQNNPVERYNRTLKQTLAIFARDSHTTWDQHLKFVIFAMRTAVSEVTGFTPAKLVFGRELKGFYHLFDPLHRTSVGEFDPSAYSQTLQADLAKIYAKVENAVKKAKQHQAKQYNLRSRPVTFEVGDLVFRKNFPLSDKFNQITAKLCPKYVGPFLVTEKLAADQYRLETLEGKDIGRWHSSALKSAKFPIRDGGPGVTWQFQIVTS